MPLFRPPQRREVPPSPRERRARPPRGERLPKPRRVRTRRAWLRNPIPIIDRYIASEMVVVVGLCILGFAILIVGNNFYANAEFLFSKTHPIPIEIVALLSLLEAPASMVRSLPIATTFGVMLAIGRMGRDSELIAMRSGGASLGRLIAPVLLVGLILSIVNYLAAQQWLPKVGRYAEEVRQIHVAKQNLMLPRNVFFRDEAGRIIYTPVFDRQQKTLQRPMVVWRDSRGTSVKADDHLYFWTAAEGRFDGEELIIGEFSPILFQHFAWNPEPGFDGWELWIKEEKPAGSVRFPFPSGLQDVDESEQSAEYQSAADLSETARRLQTVGRNPLKLRSQIASRYATPVACLIFAYVAFIFGIVNPRREKFSGVFYALVTIFWYYILNAILRNFGDTGFIRPPELAVWATNIIFFILATVMFLRMR